MKYRQELGHSLQARVPFDVSKPMFQLSETPRGRGWSATIDKLLDKKSIADSQAEALVQALKEHELTGEKLCRFFRVEPEQMNSMKSALDNLQIGEGPMEKAYPFLLNESGLEDLDLGKPTLIAVEATPSGRAAVFGSVRALYVREYFDPESLPADSAKMFANFDEIIALKEVRHQAFDVVWVPDDGDVIDLRTDYPKGTHADVGRGSQIALMAAFSRLVDSDPFGAPINLFPLLAKMYEADDEGRVVELAFGTTTRSMKHERMRVSADCLRTELYHMGGRAKLKTPVRPYRLSIAYTVGLGGEIEANPELNLHTTSHVADNPNPQLFDALIRKTVGVEDYDHVRQRILHFANS